MIEVKSKSGDKKADAFVSGRRWLLFSSPILIILLFTVVASLNPEFHLNPNFFYWHPFLMSISILLAALPGVMIRQMKGRIPTKIHTYMLLFSSVILLAGYYIIYRHKEFNNKPHLYSYHGQIGLAVIIGMTTLSLISLPTLEPDYKLKISSESFKSNIKSVHKWGGRALLIGSAFCMFTGFDKMVESDYLVYSWGILLSVVLLVSVRTGLLRLLSKSKKD